MDETEQRIRTSFGKQSMMETIGASIETVAAGQVTLSAPISAHLRQQHGYAHAALAFAMGDSAAGYAALSGMPLEKEVLTVEMKINLLAPAAGQRLVAEGRVVKAGRRLVVVAADVYAEDGEHRHHCAMLQGTMIPV